MGLVRNELIMAKIEATYNVDSLPVPTLNAILVMEPSWAHEGLRMVERNPVRASLAPLKSIYGGSLMTITFSVEIKGSGTIAVAPEFGVLLRSCGKAETITALTSVAYDPASVGYESCTMVYNEDGIQRKLTGCRGDVSYDFETGSYGKASFTMTGHIATETDVPLPNGSYDSTVPAVLINVPFTIGAYSAAISKLAFAMGNSLAYPASISAIDGYGEIRIGSRKVVGSFDPEAVLKATNDFVGQFRAGTNMALDTGVIGSVVGNRYRATMPSISYTEIAPGDREGIRIYDTSFEASEVTTDDEMQLLFT